MTDKDKDGQSRIFTLHAQRPVKLSPLEQRHVMALLDDIAALCEVAGLSHQLKADDMLEGYITRLQELRRINLESLPAQKLDAQQLGIFTGGRCPHLFDKAMTAAQDGPRLDTTTAAGRAELIRRVTEDTRAIIEPIATFLQDGQNRQYGLYYAQQIGTLLQNGLAQKYDTHAAATNEGVLKLPEILDNKDLDLFSAFDGRGFYKRLNAALAANGLPPEPSPYPEPPQRPQGGKPQLRIF